MERRILAANWKMNPQSAEEAVELARELDRLLAPLPLTKLLFPPFVFLPLLEVRNLTIGAQNVFWEEKGAYTGEVSPPMLKSVGAEWVLVGHSERRNILGERDEDLKRKAEAALKNGLKVVFCVGEKLKDREAGRHFEVIRKQLEYVPKREGVVIAYEPVWAIGTGKNATPEQIGEMHAFIKEIFNTKVLYGGSVKGHNAKELASTEGVDGFLVGGASLKPSEFYKIGEALAE
ncbi:MAG: triose-phosphate isomerase [Thermotogae bacterium]|nr:triose-phosphate isomerase [Thermotogota bacterium]